MLMIGGKSLLLLLGSTLVRCPVANLVFGSFHPRFCALSNCFASTADAFAHGLACGALHLASPGSSPEPVALHYYRHAGPRSRGVLDRISSARLSSQTAPLSSGKQNGHCPRRHWTRREGGSSQYQGRTSHHWPSTRFRIISFCWPGTPLCSIRAPSINEAC